MHQVCGGPGHGRLPMEYVETDQVTDKHLYICAEGGSDLKGSMKGGVIYCESEASEDPKANIQLFGKIRRDSPKWKAYYRKRHAFERVFKGIKGSRRLEGHCVRGLWQIRLHGLMSVLRFQATALAKVQAGEMAIMRWMARKVA